MQRSKLLLASLVTVGVLGFGAAAVALDGGTGDTGSLDGTTTTTAVDSSTTTSTTVTPTTVAPVPTTVLAGAPADSADTPADGGGVARSTDGCDGGTYANHGDYVSSVAHGASRAPGDVAAAAQSDCGKPVPGTTSDESASTEPPESQAPASDGPASPGNSANAGNGNGNGNGNGRSHP